MATVDFNIFSNVAATDPARCLAPDAIRSVLAHFPRDRADGFRIRAFVDPKPHPEAWQAWCAAIRESAGAPVEIVETAGLADGYRRSIETAASPYALQWEHDFVLVPGRLRHDLSTLLRAMSAGEITHLRFNKRRNRMTGYDHVMRPAADTALPMCRVNGRSNNPHLIDVDYYRRDVLPYILSASRAADGLEGHLCHLFGGGFVYGDLGAPAVVRHLDGRSVRRVDGLRRRLHRLAGAGSGRSIGLRRDRADRAGEGAA